MTLGDTAREPGAATPPIPLSISTESAFVTAPQLKVDEPPSRIDEGDAVNDEITGVPLQPTGGGGAGKVYVAVGTTRGIGVKVRVGAVTLIVNVRWTFCPSSVMTRKVCVFV